MFVGVGELALADVECRDVGTQSVFDGGQDAGFVVDEHVVPGRDSPQDLS